MLKVWNTSGKWDSILVAIDIYLYLYLYLSRRRMGGAVRVGRRITLEVRWDQSHLIPLSSHQAPKNYFAQGRFVFGSSELQVELEKEEDGVWGELGERPGREVAREARQEVEGEVRERLRVEREERKVKKNERVRVIMDAHVY